MSENNQAVLSEFYKLVKSDLVRKLRPSRLAPIMSGQQFGQRISDLGIVTGCQEPEFVHRFGFSLEKVAEADIAALTLYLPSAESLTKALGELRKHIAEAPEGKTGLPYFDEWEPADDTITKERPLVWYHDYQDEARSLLEQGWRIGKSKPSSDEGGGVFVTVFISRQGG